MEFKSEQKHLIISPRKVRPVVEIIKKMSPLKALDVLPFIKKRASEHLYKVVKSAIANASQAGADVNSLIFKEIQVGEGPRLRRGQPVSRGRWHPIKKRMSHIRVVLQTKRAKQIEDKKKTVNKAVSEKETKVVKTKKVVKVNKERKVKNVAKN